MDLVTSSFIAKQCNVTNACVSNWVRRNVLPGELLPSLSADCGNGKRINLWDYETAENVVAWHALREHKRDKART